MMAGVPENLQSCHTATVGWYTIAGHVPVADIERLLDEKPKVVGLSVPGMPSGSPGMENGQHEPYGTTDDPAGDDQPEADDLLVEEGSNDGHEHPEGAEEVAAHGGPRVGESFQSEDEQDSSGHVGQGDDSLFVHV